MLLNIRAFFNEENHKFTYKNHFFDVNIYIYMFAVKKVSDPDVRPIYE